jgi:hypothetical protein
MHHGVFGISYQQSKIDRYLHLGMKIAYRYFYHDNMVQFATKRLNYCTLPTFSSTLTLSKCSTSIHTNAQKKKVAKLRQPSISLCTHPYHKSKRYFAPLVSLTSMKNAQTLLVRCTIACRHQTRCYNSKHKTLPHEPEIEKEVIKHLPSDKCKVEFFHSKHDFRDYFERSREYVDAREDMDDSYHNGIFTVHFHSNPIVKTAIEYYNNKSGMVRQELEYYARKTKQWKKFPFAGLSNDPDIQYYKGKGSRPIPLRVRSEYEEYTTWDDERGPSKKHEKLIAIGEDKPKVMEILYILKVISQRFRRLEFQRTDEDKHKISSKIINMGAPISLEQWIKDQATIDEELSVVLLRQPGALQHIVTCFAELDILWNFEKDPFVVDEEDDMEKYRKRTKPDIRHRGKKKKTKEKREREKMKKKRRSRLHADPEDMYFKL